MKRWHLNVFLLLCISGLLSGQHSPYWQQHIVYNLDIDVNTQDFTYQGKQQITYTNNAPHALDRVFFHLYWNAFQPGSMMDQLFTRQQSQEISQLSEHDQGRQTILTLTQNGIPLTYHVEGTILEVTLAQAIPPGKEVNLEMSWRAKIPKFVTRGGKNNGEGIDLTMTQWYPKMVEYDYNGWHADEYLGGEFHGVFGDFDVKIHIDSNYVVGAGGQLQNPTTVNGYGGKSTKAKQTYHFKANDIHDFAWVADPNFSVETQQLPTGPTLYYVYEKKAYTNDWTTVRPYVAQFFNKMKTKVGAYVYPTYSILQGGDGGMEYGMCTVIKGGSNSLKDLASLIFHEGAHSWFQHILASDENSEAYLDEGMTTYISDEILSEVFKDSSVHPFTESYNYYFQAQRSGNIEPMSTLADHYTKNFAYTIGAYYKAVVFYTQLGYIIGKDKLDESFKSYFDTWKMKHPTTNDFKSIVQYTSGMNLRWYFNQFITTNGVVDYAITSVKAKDQQTEVTLVNNGDIAMPIDLYLTTTQNDTLSFYIPLKMMRHEKSNEFPHIPRKTASDWGWTQKEYTLLIDLPKDQIQNLTIDATQRLADVNYRDNRYVK